MFLFATHNKSCLSSTLLLLLLLLAECNIDVVIYDFLSYHTVLIFDPTQNHVNLLVVAHTLPLILKE